MAFNKSAMRGVNFPMQVAATTGNGTPAAIPPSFFAHQFVVKWSAGVSAGAIQIETADKADYSGTWAAVGAPIATAAASSEQVSNITGTYGALRARVSTTVVGGTVDVSYVGN